MHRFIFLAVVLGMCCGFFCNAQSTSRNVPSKAETIKWIVTKFIQNIGAGFTAEYEEESNTLTYWKLNYWKIPALEYEIFLDKVSNVDVDEDGLFILSGAGCARGLFGLQDKAIITCINYDSEDNLQQRFLKAFTALANYNKKKRDPNEAFWLTAGFCLPGALQEYSNKE